MKADPKPLRRAKPLDVPDSLFKAASTPCRSCKEPIWWWRNPRTGKTVPVNMDKTSHFTTCDHPERFSKKKQVETMMQDIGRCARCGADHADVEFMKLGRPAKEFGWWAPCPLTGEPILLRIKDEKEER
jgi:hypothetical protein